jgi:type II secretion system protein C
MASAPTKWTIAGVLTGVSALSWMSAIAVSRVATGVLTLPEDAEITAVAVAPGEVSDTDDASPATPSVADRRARSASSYIKPIIKRSLFDSSLVDAVATETAATGDGGEDGVPSDLKVVLLATLVADPPEFSSALIAEQKGEDGALGYGIGDNLLGEGEIVRIEPRKVYVKRLNGSIEYISMEDGQSYEKDKKKGGGKKSKKGKDDEENGISKEGPNKFIVDQEVIDKVMENPEQLYSQIRATPHKDGSAVDGYRLSGIRRRSLFYQLGIKNGDIVHTVNGTTLDSMSSAMGAYNSLQNDKNFTFEVTRRNKRQTFEYEVR